MGFSESFELGQVGAVSDVLWEWVPEGGGGYGEKALSPQVIVELLIVPNPYR